MAAGKSLLPPVRPGSLPLAERKRGAPRTLLQKYIKINAIVLKKENKEKAKGFSGANFQGKAKEKGGVKRYIIQKKSNFAADLESDGAKEATAGAVRLPEKSVYNSFYNVRNRRD